MAKNVVGIDISDFSIEALALEKEKRSFVVEAYSRFRLSPEVVEDGRILDRDRLKDAIVKLLANAKPHPLEKTRKVFLSIPESQTFSRVLTVPKNIKDKELIKATLNKAEELIPESMDNLVSIVKLLPQSGDNKQAFYTAAEMEVLKDFISVFDDLGIGIEGITTESISSFYGLRRDDKQKKNVLVLDLGARTTIASIFSQDCLCSSININIGGDKITEAIAAKLNISYDQAEEKKRSVGFSSGGGGEIMLIAQGQLQPLIDELRVFIKYWQESTSRVIDEVVLIGGLSQMNGIDKYFGEDLNLPTQLGQPFIDKKSFPTDLNFSKYINVLGLARLGHQNTDINFYNRLPKEDNKKSKDTQAEGDQAEDKPKDGDKKSFRLDAIKNFFVSIFTNKYFWIGLAVAILAVGVWLFKDHLWPEKKEIIRLEQNIFVSRLNPDNRTDYVNGAYFNPGGRKTYKLSEDDSVPEDYVDTFANTLARLENEAVKKIVTFINDDEYAPEGYYVIPRVISYEVLEVVPSEEDYQPGQDLEADMDFTFMVLIEDEVKGLLTEKYPELKDNIYSLDYEILSYSQDENGDYFDIKVLVNHDIK